MHAQRTCILLRLGTRLLLLALLRLAGAARFGVHDIVPPPETAGVVAQELLVVHIVMIRAGPERQEVVQ